MFDKNINSISYKDINELLYVRKIREGQRLDYKRDFYKDAKEFLKDATAFANSEGGYIIFGIDEKKNIINGISKDFGNTKIDDWIPNVLNSNTDKTVECELQFVAIDDDEIPLFIVILYIKESSQKPVYVTTDNKSLCYIRKGSSVFLAKPNDIKEMYLKTAGTKSQNQVTVSQKSKGNNNIQVGINQGSIIKADKIINKNEITPNPEIHISGEQAQVIKKHIDEIVKLNEKAGRFQAKEDKDKFYRKTWNSFKRAFSITSYHLLLKERFDEAIVWLQQQEAIQKPKLRRTNNEEWRRKNYAAIFSRLRQLGFEKEKAYEIANEKLSLKKPIDSLTDLEEQKLEKLYQIIIRMK